MGAPKECKNKSLLIEQLQSANYLLLTSFEFMSDDEIDLKISRSPTLTDDFNLTC